MISYLVSYIAKIIIVWLTNLNYVASYRIKWLTSYVTEVRLWIESGYYVQYNKLAFLHNITHVHVNLTTVSISNYIRINFWTRIATVYKICWK